MPNPNPRIPKADGDAPVQAYIKAMPGWQSDVGRRVDELVTRVVPNVRKAVRWNSPFTGTTDDSRNFVRAMKLSVAQALSANLHKCS